MSSAGAVSGRQYPKPLVILDSDGFAHTHSIEVDAPDRVHVHR